MATQINPYPLRIDEEIMAKLKIIAKKNGRSVNKEIEYALRKYKEKYEEEYGSIILDSEIE